MLELLVGGLLRIIPEIGNLIDKQKQREFEIEMLKAKTNAELQIVAKRADVAEAQGELQAMGEATKAQNGARGRRTGSLWFDVPLALVDLLSSTVRPILTYWFCVAGYGSYKAALYFGWSKQNFPWDTIIQNIWTPMDERIVLSIIGFWFVDRAIRHFNDKS